MDKQLAGKKALVTGASRGIGRKVAELFCRHGAQVFCCARTREKLGELEAELQTKEGRVQTRQVDISDSSQIKSFFDFISKHTDTLDTVINAAGIHITSRIDAFTEADYNKIMDTNLKAPLLICRQAVPFLEKSGSGTIVNVSSLSGCFGIEKFEGFGLYDISKYGLWGLTEILALELKHKNIRVNQVSPSGVDTEMFWKAVPPGVKPSLSPLEVANIILYLAGNKSEPLSGENIRIFGK